MNIRRQIFFALLERHNGFVIQLVSNVVVARLLTPEEIGIYSVSTALLAAVYVVREFGITTFLIQVRDLTEEKIRAAFGLMILLSWPLGAVFWFLRDSISQLYGHPEIGNIIGIMAMNFIILPFGQPARGLLNREMRFKSLTLIDTTSAAMNAVAAIAFSYFGHGPISLAYASIIGTATTVVLTLYHEPRHIRLLPSLSHWRELFVFGSYSTAASLVNAIGNNAAELIIGKILDFASVGLYSRAAGLVALLQSQLAMAFARVALPSFAQLIRNGKAIEQPYLTALAHLTGVLWPAYASIALAAEPLIAVLFGDKWSGAAPVAQVLCIGGALSVVIFLVQSVYGAYGAVKRRLAAESAVQSVRILLLGLAAPFGLMAMASAQVFLTAIAGFIFYRTTRGLLAINYRDLIGAIWRSAIVTAMTGLCIIGGWKLADVSPVAAGPRLVIALFAGPVGWWLGVYSTNHILGREIRSFVEPLLGRIVAWTKAIVK